MAELIGGCLCGSVKYKGEAEPIISVNCYCVDCRKMSAVAHASLMMVSEAAIDMSGEVKAYSVKADSGSTVTHHFCPTCGSPLYNTNSSMEGVIALVASMFDAPELFKPQISVYASRAVAWDQPAADLPAFDKMPPRN